MFKLPASRDETIVEALIDHLDTIEYRAAMLDVCLEKVQDENRFFLRAKMRLAKELKYWLVRRTQQYNPSFYGKVNEGIIVTDVAETTDAIKQGLEDEVI